MIITKAKSNLKECDIARYQGRLIVIFEGKEEYDELDYSRYDVRYLANGAADIASWQHIEPVGEISKDELASIMKVFVNHWTICDAIAKIFAYCAMKEVEHEQS